MANQVATPSKSGEAAAFAHVIAALGCRRAASIPPGYSQTADRSALAERSVSLAKKCTVARAFRRIALSCLRHWALNAQAVVAGDPEGIHQMRVGLRRMRAALSIFKKPLHNDHDVAGLKRELKWLTGELGPARDLHVFLEETLKPHLRNRTDVRGLAVLDDHLEGIRREAFGRARRAVESSRFRRLVLHTFIWVTERERDPEERKISSRAFARRILTKRRRKIVKGLCRVEELDERHRHRLRIAVKKLRYGLEFFEDLFPKKKSAKRRVGRILKKLQANLGKLNDIRTHHGYFPNMIGGPPAPDEAFALGYVTGDEQSDIGAHLGSARKEGARLKKAKEYWR